MSRNELRTLDTSADGEMDALFSWIAVRSVWVSSRVGLLIAIVYPRVTSNAPAAIWKVSPAAVTLLADTVPPMR